MLKKYINNIRKYPLLSKEEENNLLQKIKNGDKAAEKELICKNLRLVILIAERYKGYGLDLQDLISEGNIGLIEAIRKFDICKGVKFIFFITLYINKFIIKALNSSDVIRLPDARKRLLNKISREIKKSDDSLDQEDLYKRISEYLNIDLAIIKEVIKLYWKENISIEDNLEKKGTAFWDSLFSFDSVEEKVGNNLLLEKIKNTLESFPIIEKEIIYAKFLCDGKPDSFIRIGKKLGLKKRSRGSIFHIQQIAINKLKRLFILEQPEE